MVSVMVYHVRPQCGFDLFFDLTRSPLWLITSVSAGIVYVANNAVITTVDFLARRSVATGYEPVVLSGPQTKSKLVVILHTVITLILINLSN